MYEFALDYKEPPKQFETMHYIPRHAVAQFQERVCKDLTTKQVRDIILQELQKKKIVDYQRYNHKIQPVFQGEYNGVKFYMPVQDDIKHKKGDCWQVVPTILLPNMRIYNKKLEACTATDVAIEFEVDRSTILDWLYAGKIRAKKHEPGHHWKIYNLEVKRLKKEGAFQKPYPKWSRNYSETERHVIINNKDKPAAYIAKLIGRNANSVKIMRCRMRKEGYDV